MINTEHTTPLTIGELERLAGIQDRERFWARYAALKDGNEVLRKGCLELRRLIRQRQTKLRAA